MLLARHTSFSVGILLAAATVSACSSPGHSLTVLDGADSSTQTKTEGGADSVAAKDSAPEGDGTDTAFDSFAGQTSDTDPGLPADAASDASLDTPAVATPDAGPDRTLDVAPDVAPDVASDVAPDLPPDLSPDSPPDLAPDLPPDLPPDTSPDTTPDTQVIYPPVVISEIMYHPVQEDSFLDDHEFIELYNRTAGAVSLAGWKLADEVTYTFPAGASIPAHGYVIVARNKQALAAVAAYGLNAADLFGDYVGGLDNGGGLITLQDSGGGTLDSVRYDDKFPWPVGADALGAGTMWLRPGDLPLVNHQYRGRSLERISYDLPGAEVANWAPSPLDGATPGQPNSVSGTPPPIVETLATVPANTPQALIRSSDSVVVQVGFSQWGTVAAAKLEYFVDKVDQTGEPVVSLALTSQSGTYQATVPALPDNSIVRYRVLADRGSGMEVISPRPSDPFAWHAYFVSPNIVSASRVYQMHIAPADWGQLWTNVNFSTNARRVNGCAIRDAWDARVPAVFIYEGQVYDVFVRYQGSRWNRTNGKTITTWSYPGPIGGPSPLRALSWNVSFPRYKTMDKRQKLTLNKLNQACPGLNTGLGSQLYDAVGVPASRAKFARLYINGGYYHYMMDYEHPDEDMMKRYNAPGERMGDLFKSEGCNCDEGPYGWGDERALGSYCGYAAAERYRMTYGRQTNDWRDSSALIKLLEDLNAARGAGTTALRDFFTQSFDVSRLAGYLAVRNWAAPWDDFFQNHYLYQRADGKWLVFPWDLDLEFGQESTWSRADSSFYIGQENNSDNRSGWWNYVTDSFLQAGVYRAEFNQKMRDLDATVLSPANVKAAVDNTVSTFSESDAKAAPAGMACDLSKVVKTVKDFADARHARVAGGLN